MLNNLPFCKVKVRAGILNTVLVISLVITSLTSAIIFLAYYKNVTVLSNKIKEDMILNASSGIQYVLASEQLRDDEPHSVDLFGQGEDTIMVQNKAWGLFDIAVSTAYRGKHRESKMAMYGVAPDQYGKIALYLVDEKRPLSVAGTNRIVGDCFLPEAGVRTTYINNTGFVGGRIIEGQIQNSQSTLPQLKADFFTRIALYRYSTSWNKMYSSRYSAKSIPATLQNSFLEEPIVYNNESTLVLTQYSLLGNIILSSKKGIIVEKNTYLENVLLIAPFILFKEGFQGQVQAFASDSLTVEANCRLKYPTVLSVYSDSSKARIRIERGSQVQGIVYIGSKQQDRLLNLLKIQEEAILMGQVYANGLVEHKGSIIGSLACQRFFLTTPSTLYENHLFNSTLDVSKRSKFFVTSSLLSFSKRKDIVQWLE